MRFNLDLCLVCPVICVSLHISVLSAGMRCVGGLALGARIGGSLCTSGCCSVYVGV